MWRELFTGSPATAIAVGALLFFIAAFVGAVVWSMSRKRTDYYRRMASLPVDADEQGGPRS